MNRAGKNWDLDVKHVKAHQLGKEKKTMTTEEKFVVEGHEKADELVVARCQGCNH